MKNILMYLEASAEKHPRKTVFSQENSSVSFEDFVNQSKAIGSGLLSLKNTRRPIVLCFDKSIHALTAMMGTVYSGNFYVVLDNRSPVDRADSIINTVNPIAIITDEKNKRVTDKFESDVPVLLIEDLLQEKVDVDGLKNTRRNMIDTDPLYVLFTSGSTGTPKGTVISHKSVISYTTWLCETFNLNEKTVFGSQTPFYFSMSVSDVFGTIRCGGTLHIVPKKFFSFPVKLLEHVKEHNVNTIYWVPAAMKIVANWNAFSPELNPNLHTILFAGEVMPTKPLNVWRQAYPNAVFANLFGPTETTDICTYYIVDREFTDDESLPIGYPCNNCENIVLTEDNLEAEVGDEGELCIRGAFLSMGYYNLPEKTVEVFVQNPLNPHYPELIYRTGDLVKQNEHGELVYSGRKDFQIKLMGYRIELGEIEAAATNADGLLSGICLFNQAEEQIMFLFEGDTDEKSLRKHLRGRLPKYMIPQVFLKLDRMPHNANGKVDRNLLKQTYLT